MRAGNWIGALLIVTGGLRIAYAQVLGSPHDPRSGGGARIIDRRYAGLAQQLAAVPLEQPIAHFSSCCAEFAGQRRLGEASYALAPRVLLIDRGEAGLVIVDLDQASDAADTLARLHAQPIWRSANGVVLLARRAAPLAGLAR